MDSLAIQQVRFRQQKDQLTDALAHYRAEKTRADDLALLVKTIRQENDKLLEKYRKLEKRAKSRVDDDSRGSVS